MSNIRIIPRLDIKGPNLVKGIHLEGLRVLGKPEHFAKFYYENGADELIFQDVVASLYERNSLQDIISRTAREIFIPLTVGGGIRTLEDIRSVLRAGADKVSINTAAIKNPGFILEASRKFGSSTIVIAMECIRQEDGKYLVYTDNGREYTGIEATVWAKQAEEMGAGELLLTSVDKEGTGSGFDAVLTKTIADLVNIPVIAHGGAGSSDDVFNIIRDSGVDAVSIASVLHYQFIKGNKGGGDFSQEGNVSFLNSGKDFGKIKSCSLQQIKEQLLKNGIPTRN